MASTLGSTNVADALYNQYLGLPTVVTNASITQNEGYGSSRLFTDVGHVYANLIPSFSPDDFTGTTVNFPDGSQKRQSVSHPDLWQYTGVPLSNVRTGTSESVRSDFLQQCITSYQFYVYMNGKKRYPPNATNNYSLDGNAGVLTFYASEDPTAAVTMDFVRYEGPLLSDAVAPGLQSVTDTGNTTSNVVQFLTGLVTSNITVTGSFSDSMGPGTSGQVLTSSGTGVNWSSELFVSNARISGNLTVQGNIITESQQVLLISDPIITVGANLFQKANVGVVFDTYGPTPNVMVVYSPFSNALQMAWTRSANDSLDPVPDSTENLQVNVFGNVTANAFVATCSTGLLDQNLLVGPPPAVTDLTVTRASTYVSVSWNPPPRVSVGFLGTPLPLLKNLHGKGATVDFTSYDSWSGNAIVFSSVISDTYLDGSSFGIANQVWVHYAPSFTGDTINVWYTNYSSQSNQSQIAVGGYVTAGAPSEPLVVSATVSPTFDASLSYLPPVIQNSFDHSDFPGLSRYKFQVSSIQLNASTSPPVADIRTLLVSASTPSPKMLNSCYPESQYTVDISANNVANTMFGTTNTFAFTTDILPPPTIAAPTLTFPAPTISVYRVSDQSHLTAIDSSLTSITSDPFTFLVNTQANRGTIPLTTTVISTITTSVIGGPSLAYHTFGGAAPISSTALNLTLNPMTIIDGYSGITGSQGYYQIATANLRINLQTSSAQQSVTVQHDGSPIGFPYTYFYESLTTVPNVLGASVSFTPKTLSTAFVSGVNVVVGTSTFNASVSSVTNTGVNFQPQYPVTFTPSGGSAVNSTILGATATVSISQSYAETATLDTVVRNIKGSIVIPTKTIVGYFDQSSYTLITSTLGAGNAGALAWFSNPGSVPPPSGAASSYDQTRSIVSTPDLQISNGSFTTRGGLHALNYSTAVFPYNTVNYSGVSLTGARYATFTWSVPSGQKADHNSSASGYQHFEFIGMTSPVVNNGGLIQVAGDTFQLYYKYIDESNPVSNFNTGWFSVTDTDNAALVNGTRTVTVNTNNNYVATSGSCKVYMIVGLPMSQPVAFKFVTLN